MARWTLRAGVLLVAGGLLFAWVPDIDLGQGWGGDRADSAPETGPYPEAVHGAGCGQEVDTTPDPSTDITAFRAERSGSGVLLTADFHDLLPGVREGVEFDLRTSQGRDVNVTVEQQDRAAVEVRIGDAPDPVEAAANECSAAVSLQQRGDCEGLTARMDASADVVIVRVPRHCLGDPRWVRAGVSSVRRVSEAVVPHDVWLPPGGNRHADFGPLGPWVSLLP